MLITFCYTSNVKINTQVKIKIFLIVFILAISFFIAYFPKKTAKIPKIDSERQYQVVKVIDGDTYEIKIDEQIWKVRMLGVDTPETVDPRKTVQCFGKEASDRTKELLIGRTVTLQIDSGQSSIDKFGRLLAYTYRDDGLFVNSYLIENGFAHEYTYNFPYQRQEEFKDLQNKAKKEKIGLWGSLCLQK